MNNFHKIVDSILKQHNIELQNIETWHIPVNYKYYKNDIQISIKESMYKKADKLDNYFNNLSANDIKILLLETDNTVKREHDLILINQQVQTIYNLLQNYLLDHMLDYNKPKYMGAITLKQLKNLPKIYLIPKNNKAIAQYIPSKDTICLNILNKDGTYNPIEFINFITSKELKEILTHELTHRQDKLDYKANNKKFGFSGKLSNKEYANDKIELNAFTNQLIKSIEDDLKDTSTLIKNNNQEYSWKQAIFKAINYLLSNRIKNNDLKDIINNISDSNLKKIYRTIYEYFYKKYFTQYILNNPDQYNKELKNLTK